MSLFLTCFLEILTLFLNSLLPKFLGCFLFFCCWRLCSHFQDSNPFLFLRVLPQEFTLPQLQNAASAVHQLMVSRTMQHFVHIVVLILKQHKVVSGQNNSQEIPNNREKVDRIMLRDSTSQENASWLIVVRWRT